MFHRSLLLPHSGSKESSLAVNSYRNEYCSIYPYKIQITIILKVFEFSSVIGNLAYKIPATGTVNCMTDLFGELFFTQLVQCIKLASQCNILQKATACKFNSDNDLAIRNHHGYCAELDLQILR